MGCWFFDGCNFLRSPNEIAQQSFVFSERHSDISAVRSLVLTVQYQVSHIQAFNFGLKVKWGQALEFLLWSIHDLVRLPRTRKQVMHEILYIYA